MKAGSLFVTIHSALLFNGDETDSRNHIEMGTVGILITSDLPSQSLYSLVLICGQVGQINTAKIKEITL